MCKLVNIKTGLHVLVQCLIWVEQMRISSFKKINRIFEQDKTTISILPCVLKPDKVSSIKTALSRAYLIETQLNWYWKNSMISIFSESIKTSQRFFHWAKQRLELFGLTKETWYCCTVGKQLCHINEISII